MEKKFNSPSLWILLGFLLFLLGATSLFLINLWAVLHSLVLALFIVLAVMGFLNKNKLKSRKVLSFIGFVFSLSEILFLFHYNYIFLCVNAFASIVIGFVLVVLNTAIIYRKKMKASPTKSQKVITVIEATLLSTMGVFVLFIVFFLMSIAVKPSVGINLLIPNTNTFEPLNKPTSTVMHDGTLYLNDIQYGDTYPRSFLDIYVSNKETSTSKPTYIFIHGGGFIMGDKVIGDPYAVNDADAQNHYYLHFTEKGYNVVAINYAFAPEHPYPTPILQLSEAVDFLKQHSDEYGLDMTKVIIGGNSAGGHIAGQFAIIQTNSKYAEEVNMKPVLSGDSIKAVILNSALLEPTKFDESIDSSVFDYELSIAGRSYWGNDFETNELAKEASIINHATKDFPPVFMTDGNTTSFYEQAKLFDQKLDELGVEHVFNFYGKDKAELPHSYEMSLSTEYGYKNMVEMFKFLDKQLNQNKHTN